MSLRQIAAWIVLAGFALGPAKAAQHTVELTIHPTIVPELVPSQTPGDFLLAVGTASGVYGYPIVDGMPQPSRSLLPILWRGGFASAQLSPTAGGGMLLSFAQTVVRGAPFAAQTVWARPLDSGLAGPDPRLVNSSSGWAVDDPPAEMDLLTGSGSVSCCTLLAASYPRIGTLTLEVMNARGEVLVRRELRVDGSADLRVRRPTLAYQPDAGFFVVAYETRRDIRVRRVYVTPQAGGGADFKWIGADEVVALKTQPARYEDLVDGHPQIAYSPELRQFLVTWLDHVGSSGEARRVMARTLSRAGSPSGASFAVQSSCPPTSWSCTLLRPTVDGAPQVLAIPGGFHVGLPARAWTTSAPLWGVLGYRLTPSGSGFSMSWRWLTARTEARITALRTAYDRRSGIAAATWLATTTDVGEDITIANTSLLIGDFLP